MTDESKIIWADELWVPPSAMRDVNGGHIVATQLSLRFIEGKYTHPLYSHPPQRTWVELTEEQMNELWANSGTVAGYNGLTFENIRAVSAKLKELNT